MRRLVALALALGGLASCASTRDATSVDADTGDSVASDTAADTAGDSALDTSGVDSAPDDTAAPDTSCSTGLSVLVDAAPLAGALTFDAAPARSDARTRTLVVRNDCPGTVRFLGHPDDWLTGEGVTLEALPPVALAGGEEAGLTLRWTPGESGAWSGSLTLPHDGPDSPLVVELAATATAPLALVLAGDGAHVLATRDYGDSVAYEHWTTTEAHTRALMRGVCAGPGGFLAVGGNAERAWWTSADGVTWTVHEEVGGFLGGCAWLGDRFVAFDDAPLWSLDGQAWTRGTGSAVTHMRAIAAGARADGSRLAVAVGDGGRVSLTEDGTRWTTTAAVTSEGLGFVAFGDGVFVAAGGSGRTVASADGGATWVQGSTGGGTAAGLVWAGDAFFLGDGTSVYRSHDGVGWTRVNAARPAPVAAVGAQVFGVVGTRLYVSTDGGFSWSERVGGAGGLGFSAGAAVELRP